MSFLLPGLGSEQPCSQWNSPARKNKHVNEQLDCWFFWHLTVQQVLNPGVANAGVAATAIFFFFPTEEWSLQMEIKVLEMKKHNTEFKKPALC